MSQKRKTLLLVENFAQHWKMSGLGLVMLMSVVKIFQGNARKIEIEKKLNEIGIEKLEIQDNIHR